MSTRSMLVCYPGYPFDWGALTPQRTAASVAGSLIDAGHTCVIRDYGTVDTLERLTPPNGESIAKPLMSRIRSAVKGAPLSGLPGYMEVARANAKFRKLQAEHCVEVGKSIGREAHTDFAGFLVQSADDAHCVNLIAAAAKSVNADLPLIAYGSFVQQYGGSLRHSMPHVDWLCGSEPEMGLPAFGAVAHDRSRWSSLPGAVTDSGRIVQPAEQRWTGPFASLPDPVYDADTYPAVSAHEKLLIFEVEDSVSIANAEADGSNIRLRPVEEICNHIWQLRAQFGAGLIRFTGRSTPALHMRGILNGLTQRGVDILYSRRQSALTADPSFYATDFASGCILHTHEVFSGSQWLHDRFYRSGSTITEMENALRASKRAGIETVAELTYPCPADDYHTRDETMRLLRRTNPHATSIRLPEVFPSSHWLGEKKQRGFEIPRSGLASRAMKCLSMYPLALHQWDRVAYGMKGRGAGEVQHDLDGLRTELAEFGIQPFDGEIASLVRAATSAMTGKAAPVPTYNQRPFVDLNTFVHAVDSCRGIAAASRENGRVVASAGLRPVAGDRS
jgi:hypothetical protein